MDLCATPLTLLYRSLRKLRISPSLTSQKSSWYLLTNLRVFTKRKPTVFGHTSGGRYQSVVGAKTRQPDDWLHTHHYGRERKVVIWSEKLHRFQEVIATTDRPSDVDGFPSAQRKAVVTLGTNPEP